MKNLRYKINNVSESYRYLFKYSSLFQLNVKQYITGTLLILAMCLFTINSGAQCTDTLQVVNGNSPLLTNKINAFNSFYFCQTTHPGGISVGRDTSVQPEQGMYGEVTVNFPQPTGLIEIYVGEIWFDQLAGGDWLEVYLNDTFIDLSTFPGVSITQGTPGCASNSQDSLGVTTASFLGYPGKAGVLYRGGPFGASNGGVGRGIVTIDLAAHGLAASKLKLVRDISSGVSGFGGVLTRTTFCSDSIYPSQLTLPMH